MTRRGATESIKKLFRLQIDPGLVPKSQSQFFSFSALLVLRFFAPVRGTAAEGQETEIESCSRTGEGGGEGGEWICLKLKAWHGI